MGIINWLRRLAGVEADKDLSLGNRQRAVETAVAQRYAYDPQRPDMINVWCVDVFDDNAVVYMSGEYYRIDYTMDDDDTVTLGTELERVESVWVPKAVDEIIAAVPGSLSIFVDKAGKLRWLAVTSNNFEDRDGEWLSESAHKEFIDAIAKGETEYPELWVWHIPGSRIGVADSIVWHDAGFRVDVGTFDKGMDAIAEHLATQKNLGVSHGFKGIRDGNVWTWYRSRETSVLPIGAAANVLTAFNVLGDEMQFSDEQRKKLAAVMTDDGIRQLEDNLTGKSSAAVEAGLTQKEGPPTVTKADLDAVTDGVKALADGVKTAFEQLDVRFTEAFKAIIAPVGDQLTAVQQKQGEQDTVLVAMQAEIAKLKESDDAKLSAMIAPKAGNFAAGYRPTTDPATVPGATQVKQMSIGKDWVNEFLGGELVRSGN